MWLIRKFNALTLNEMKQIFRLRQSIFIIELKSYFEDIDSKDSSAIHMFNKDKEIIRAYCRVLIHDEKEETEENF